ncbi:MAG: winged helix-turn-helix domain-containing protein [Anaerolineales bacterium]|nr:winged helix-turn-helix domain-containing protein [Anaerolineales bacterium]
MASLFEWQQLVETHPVAAQQAAFDNHVAQDAFEAFAKTHAFLMNRLQDKGIFIRNTAVWTFSSKLLASFLREMKGHGLGKIWLDDKTGDVYQGQRHIEKLTPLEKGVLHYLVKFPRMQHTKTDLMENAWPDDVVKEEITDGSLYRVISGLRKKIEPVPSKPCYLLNWRGIPEGGYQLFPEGRPR